MASDLLRLLHFKNLWILEEMNFDITSGPHKPSDEIFIHLVKGFDCSTQLSISCMFCHNENTKTGGKSLFKTIYGCMGFFSTVSV